jgi:hypothetical protein
MMQVDRLLDEAVIKAKFAAPEAAIYVAVAFIKMLMPVIPALIRKLERINP